jgi:predicted ATP-grasp superfamily ATP-dependent carboligase
LPAIGHQDAGTIVRSLMRVGEGLNHLAILMPTDDESSIIAAEHANELRARYILPQVPTGLPRVLASKQGLSQCCARHGIPTPRTVFAHSVGDVLAFAADAGFPIIIKNSEPWTRISAPAVASTTIVETREKLLALAETWATDPQVIAQEYIPDQVAEDWIFHAYCDRDANPLVTFTGRKQRSWPPHRGVTTLAMVIPNERLSTKAAAFCRSIGYRGIVDMDWRFDTRDGRYKLVDCNPRLGANFRLFVSDAEIDVVRAEHLDLTGRPVPVSSQAAGRQFVVENLDLASRMVGGRGRTAKPAPRRRETEYAWFALDDPLPFLAMGLRFSGPVLHRLWSALLAKAKIRFRR